MKITSGYDMQRYSVLDFSIVDKNKVKNHITTIHKEKYDEPIREIRIATEFFYFTKGTTGRNKSCNLDIYSTNSDGTNLLPMTEEVLKNRLFYALEYLESVCGIKICLKDIRLYTGEVNVNFYIDESFEKYKKLLDGISASIKNHNNDKYGILPYEKTGFTVSSDNGVRAYKVYDKKDEMLRHDGVDIAQEVLRFEQETNYRKRKDVSLSGIKESEIKEEIYKNMILPYLKDLKKRQKSLDLLYQEFCHKYKKISKQARDHFISNAFSSDIVGAVDILEPLYCLYRNTPDKNKSRMKVQLNKLYSELYNEHNFKKYGNHKRIIDIISSLGKEVPQELNLQFTFLNKIEDI